MINLIFDLDDTLYSRKQVFLDTCRELLADKYNVDWVKLESLRNVYGDQMLSDMLNNKMSKDEYAYQRLNKAFNDLGTSISYQQAKDFEQRYDYHLYHLQLTPPFDTLFPYLKNYSIPMAICSNGPSNHQREKLRSLQMQNYIPEELWLVSGDYNTTKPDPLLFHKVEERLHNKPIESYMIGDGYKSDIIGAKNVGWHTIWLNEKKIQAEGNYADYTVESLSQLNDLLIELVKKDCEQ